MPYDALFGKPAPAITLPNYTGESFTMTPGEGGIPIVLFFYPKAGTKLVFVHMIFGRLILYG